MKKLTTAQRIWLADILGRQSIAVLRRDHVNDWLTLSVYLSVGKKRRYLPSLDVLMRLAPTIRLGTLDGLGEPVFMRDVVMPWLRAQQQEVAA